MLCVSCSGDESELHIIIFDEIDAICKVSLLAPKNRQQDEVKVGRENE